MPLSKKLSLLTTELVFKDFVSIGFLPTAMTDEKSVCPKIETGYAFTKNMVDNLVRALNRQFLQKGGDSLRKKYVPPEDIKFNMRQLWRKLEK